MRLRKLLLTLATGVILLGACAAPATPLAPAETPPPIPEPTPMPTPSPTPAPTPTPEPAPAPTPTPTPTSVGSAPIPEGSMPIINAHSQVGVFSESEEYPDLNKVIQLMDEAGVAGTILMARGVVTPEELVSF